MLVRQKTYPYNRLPDGDVFRYLILQPGAEDEPLVCNIRNGTILDVEYDAVSYVWGTSVRDQLIECDGHEVLITANLSQLLRRIRSPSGPQVLWADSICINQYDNKDKGHQVGLMGKIYRSAKRVLISMGPDLESHGPAVCSLLEEVDQMIQATCKTIDMSWNSFPYPDEDDRLHGDPRWDSLLALLSQAWFDRGWVVQEAALAKQGKVIWGESCFNWETLMRVYTWLSACGHTIFDKKEFQEVLINAHTNVYLETHVDFARAFYSEASWGKSSLLRTLNCAKELDLSDPRDRIYAFMELPQFSGHQITIRPDYSAPFLETYHRFAIEYIEKSKTTELLDYVSHHQESLTSGIPSWVPRWDFSTWSLQGTYSVATGMQSRSLSTSEPVITEAGLLKVRGVVLDAIHYASDIFTWDTTTLGKIKDLWDALSSFEIETPYTLHANSYMLDAFLDALAAGGFNGELTQWNKAREQFAYKAGLRKNVDDSDQGQETDSMRQIADDSMKPYYPYIRAKLDDRHVVLTKRGYMGLAPLPTREGDTCAIIFGCALPCVLRRNDDGLSHIFVGPMTLVGQDIYNFADGHVGFLDLLGEDESREWVDWDVEEQDIYLC